MAEEKKDITEVKAFARGIHISPQKARLVAAVVKKLPVGDALTQLEFMTKKAAHPIKKLINSAVANASHNFQIETDRLFVKNLTIDQGQVFMRYQPRAQGRAFPVRKRTSHMSLTLGVAREAFKISKKFVTLKKEAKEEVKPQSIAAPEKAGASEKKASRFAFWRRRKEPDTTQVPPKEDVKGKHYTGFDRRGNMP